MSVRMGFAISSICFAALCAICFHTGFPEWGIAAGVLSGLMGIEALVKDDK